MKRVLIMGAAWVGDMVMAQTLFKILKQRSPDTLIDVLAPAPAVHVTKRMSEVRHSMTLPFTHGELNLRGRYRFAQTLRSEKYDQAIVLPNSFKSALIPWWAGIPHRIGWRGEFRWKSLNDVRTLDKKKLPLMIQRFAALGFPADAALPAELPKPSLTSNAHVSSSRPVLAICPGAEYGPAKRWPAEYFAAIAEEKLKAGWEVWILGGPKDQPIAQAIQTASHHACLDLTGKTSITEAIDRLAQATVVVSNDSGLMHIACALDRPTIVIYGSSDPRFTPPLSDRAKILSLHLPCSPCFQRTCPLKHGRCLRDLKPDQVLQTLESMT